MLGNGFIIGFIYVPVASFILSLIWKKSRSWMWDQVKNIVFKAWWELAGKHLIQVTIGHWGAAIGRLASAQAREFSNAARNPDDILFEEYFKWFAGASDELPDLQAHSKRILDRASRR